MLEVHGLKAAYGRIQILNGVDFKVDEGQVLGILGHNGMGKTTLMRTLMGFVSATSGSIRLDGRDITRQSTYRRARAGLGYVPQGREIFPKLSVMDNLRMAAVRAAPDRIDQVLEGFPRLQEMLDRPGAALSGGEQQILAIARSLCTEPRLVLLDEPTEGIQPSIIDQIVDLLVRLNRDQGLTVVVVEQNLDFIAALASRVLIIQRGRILRELVPAQLQDPDVVDEFVGMTA
jgi:urea ABC transporter ATP-binding protein UrtE